MLALIAVIIFLNSALLFWLEPMISKMILPYLGGSPSVWNTCVAFFQTVLLTSYAYVRWLTTRTNKNLQFTIHLLVVLFAFFFIPLTLALPNQADLSNHPLSSVLIILTRAIGLPFFVLCSTSPLLSKWLVSIPRFSNKSPYILFSISNAGSLLALAAYPLALERFFPLDKQSGLWNFFYLALSVSIMGVAFYSFRQSGEPIEKVAVPNSSSRVKERFLWFALSFVPSSLMLAVTTYISSNIAPIPFLWTVSLGLYLLTFIISFSGDKLRRPIFSLVDFQVFSGSVLSWVAPMLFLCVGGLLIATMTHSATGFVTFHLIVFFLLALMCHSRLAQNSPENARLTEFYLWSAFGSAMGGIFNAMVAPLIFKNVSEYPIGLALACMLKPPRSNGEKFNRNDLLIPVAVGIGFALVPEALRLFSSLPPAFDQRFFLVPGAILCLFFATRPVLFGLTILSLIVASSTYPVPLGSVVHAERSFFGVHRILKDQDHHWLQHGDTIHGGQFLAREKSHLPLTYYHPAGPLGQFFHSFNGGRVNSTVSVIGMGTGSMISYGRPSQKWTFYEIDPSVIRIAKDPAFFSFLQYSPAPYTIVQGDGRLTIASSEPAATDLIVIDAFGSDSIPTHLLTIEAFQLYLSKLKKDGVLLLHISNRYLDLTPVVANAGAELGLSVWSKIDVNKNPQTKNERQSSHWVVMSFQADRWRVLQEFQWTPLQKDPSVAVWTDDYSDVMSLLF